MRRHGRAGRMAEGLWCLARPTVTVCCRCPGSCARCVSGCACLRLCLSQEDLAARTGLSVRTIRNIESGRVAVPRPASLRLLRGIIDEAAVIPRWACPSTLPADVTDFCGRRDEFTEVADHLRSARTGMPVVAIHGRPGVGKTALLVHLGNRLRREFLDGQLYLHLGGRRRPVPPFTALDRLLRVLLGDGMSSQRSWRPALSGFGRPIARWARSTPPASTWTSRST